MQLHVNPNLPSAALDEAIKTVQRISSPELLASNEAFHHLLTEGVNVLMQNFQNQPHLKIHTITQFC